MVDTNPWERQRDENGQLESNLWYNRFTRYRLLGSDRSMTAACNLWRAETGRKEQGYPSWRWRVIAEQWNWKQRAEAWDEHLRQQDEAEWVARREETRKQEWESSGQLLKRVEQMLIYPLTQATQEEDGRVTIIKPVRWTQGDIARFIEAASKLRRLATGLETGRQQVEIISDDDLNGAIATELARLSGLSTAAVLAASKKPADTAEA